MHIVVIYQVIGIDRAVPSQTRYASMLLYEYDRISSPFCSSNGTTTYAGIDVAEHYTVIIYNNKLLFIIEKLI